MLLLHWDAKRSWWLVSGMRKESLQITGPDNVIATMKSPCWKYSMAATLASTPSIKIIKQRKHHVMFKLSPKAMQHQQDFPHPGSSLWKNHESCEMQIKRRYTLRPRTSSGLIFSPGPDCAGTKLGSWKLECPAAPVRQAAMAMIGLHHPNTKVSLFHFG